MNDLGIDRLGIAMRTRLLVACLMFGPILAGCQFQRKPPYARDPDLLYYKPALTTSAEVMSEQTARRKPTPPPKPALPRDALALSAPTPDAARPATSPYGLVVKNDRKSVNAPGNSKPARAPEPNKVVSPPAPAPARLPEIKEPVAADSTSKVIEPPPEEPKPAKSAARDPVEKKSATVAEEPKADEWKTTSEPPHDIVIAPPKSNEERPARPSETSQSHKLPTPPADLESSKGPTRTISGNFGRDADYTWLQGVLEKNFRGEFALRFRHPSEEDQYGGKVRLEEDPRLADYKHGDVIAVTGQIEPETIPSETWKYPRFRIKSLAKVDAK